MQFCLNSRILCRTLVKIKSFLLFQPTRTHATQLRWTIYATAVVSIPYSLIRLYRINAAISLVLVLMAATRLPLLLSKLTSRQHGKEE